MAAILEHSPSEEELKRLLTGSYPVWKEIEQYLFDHYQVETQWANGGKAGVYEYKFRSASRTLCGFYARNGSFGFLVTLGRKERERFELARDAFSQAVQSKRSLGLYGIRRCKRSTIKESSSIFIFRLPGRK